MDAHSISRPLAPRLASRAIGLILIVPSLAIGGTSPSHRTPNFLVEAPNAAAARAIAEAAEKLRRSIALDWLGEQLPNWTRPCPVRVVLTQGEAGGLTSFGFSKKGVVDQEMKLEGRLDRILASALPHEVTHTVLTSVVGGPLPRWADEGAALLAEDSRERLRHDHIASDLLARKAGFPIRTLFATEDYPEDLMGFYGQGYSVTRFLVEIGGRPRFLKFLREGAKAGWDLAIRENYGIADCQELDRAWRSWHVVLSRSEPARDKTDVQNLTMRPPANLGNE
jgi:hypothetical protein